MSKIDVKVSFVPVSGSTKDQDVSVEENASVSDVLKAAGYSQAAGNIVINGEPISDKVKIKRGDRITVSERAAGS